LINGALTTAAQAMSGKHYLNKLEKVHDDCWLVKLLS